MLTANVNGSRSRPIPGVLGECPFCGSEMVARCGEVRVHHWSHKAKLNCDVWWEPETDWHRKWKDEFPIRWQEYIFKDQTTGERHIADVHTLAGLTVEFQHSRLEPMERRAREGFYKNMIWIVDGSRLEGDRKKIDGWQNRISALIQNREPTGLYFLADAESTFPSSWLDSSMPVCFDYRGPNSDPSSSPDTVFLLYPGEVHGRRLLEPLTRDGIIRAILTEKVSLQAIHNVIRKVRNLRLR